MHVKSDEQTGQGTYLDLRFRPVTLETMNDFTSFRSMHPPFANCSCMRFRLRNVEFQRSTPSERARAFDTLVKEGTPVGVLAYLKDRPVGWCSIAPQETLHSLKGGKVDDERLWAVTCFHVDPLHRRKGVAVRLLMAAVEYARSAGAKIIEGYPGGREKGAHASMGSPSTFRKAGFRDFSLAGRKRRVMRNIVG